MEDYKPFKDASLACFAGSLFMSPFIEYMKQDGELVHAFLNFVFAAFSSQSLGEAGLPDSVIP